MKFQRVRFLLGGILLLFSCSTNTTPSSPVDQVTSSDSSKIAPVPGQLYRSKENTTTGTIHITVDENLMPIIKAEIDNFQTLYPGATVHASYLPGEEAIRRMLTEDSIRLAITTRHLSEEETAVLKQKSITAKYASLAYEGITLVVHPDNPIQTLSFEGLKEILSGKITTWSEIDSALPADPISLVFDHAQSSTIAFLQDSILKDAALSRDNVYAQSNTPEVLSYVATNPGAIGFGGWSWISDVDDRDGKLLKSGVKLLELGKRNDLPEEQTSLCAFDQEYYGPYQSFLLQRCYPLTRTITSVMRESFIGLGTGFVAHLDGPEGQRIFHKAGLATVHTIPRMVKFPKAANSRPVEEKYWEKDKKRKSK